jgi:CRP-like cAMP-binding protein
MRGDWPRRLLTLAQVLVGGVALIGVVAWTTLDPTAMLTFLFVQPVLLLGVVLFVAASLFGRKTLLVERFAAGAVVHHAGSGSDVVWVVRSGALEAVRPGAGGADEVVARLGAGDHFAGDAATPAGELPVTLRAVADTELLRINAGDLATLIAHVPGLRERIGHMLHDGNGAPAPAGSGHPSHRRTVTR